MVLKYPEDARIEPGSSQWRQCKWLRNSWKKGAWLPWWSRILPGNQHGTVSDAHGTNCCHSGWTEGGGKWTQHLQSSYRDCRGSVPVLRMYLGAVYVPVPRYKYSSVYWAFFVKGKHWWSNAYLPGREWVKQLWCLYRSVGPCVLIAKNEMGISVYRHRRVALCRWQKPVTEKCVQCDLIVTSQRYGGKYFKLLQHVYIIYNTLHIMYSIYVTYDTLCTVYIYIIYDTYTAYMFYIQYTTHYIQHICIICNIGHIYSIYVLYIWHIYSMYYNILHIIYSVCIICNMLHIIYSVCVI